MAEHRADIDDHGLSALTQLWQQLSRELCRRKEIHFHDSL